MEVVTSTVVCLCRCQRSVEGHATVKVFLCLVNDDLFQCLVYVGWSVELYI